jgi:hypothetical protein
MENHPIDENKYLEVFDKFLEKHNTRDYIFLDKDTKLFINKNCNLIIDFLIEYNTKIGLGIKNQELMKILVENKIYDREVMDGIIFCVSKINDKFIAHYASLTDDGNWTYYLDSLRYAECKKEITEYIFYEEIL